MAKKNISFSNKIISIIAAVFLAASILVFCLNYFGVINVGVLNKLNEFLGLKSRIADGELQVHFIDVGQGDCSLILSEDKAILIDTGEKENGEKIYRYLKEHGVRKLDCFIISHPHSDHMGAASYIVDNVEIDKLIMPQVKDELVPTTKSYEKLLKSAGRKSLKITAAKPGMKIDAGDGEIEIISPVKDYDDLNNYSVAVMLTHGNKVFLFSGDIEKKAEKDILEAGYLKDVDVLKVPHHGSNTSSSKEFLAAVKPETAIIMCDGVSYNHPHEKALKRLLSCTEDIYRTDINGTVVITSKDGELNIKTEK